MSFFKNPEKVEGGQRKVEIVDRNVEDILDQILKELKKLNMHLSFVTDENIENTDID